MGAASGRYVILSAPSGAGKTTIVHYLLEHMPELEFSVSATTRTPRKGEVNGRDYHFLDLPEFERRKAAGDLIEWEEVYKGQYYGTLRSVLDEIAARGHHAVFDVDVVGGLRLKDIFGPRALAIFISPPSLEVLEQRLRARGTEDGSALQRRLAKADREMEFAPEFDAVVVNDDLQRSCKETLDRVREFLVK